VLELKIRSFSSFWGLGIATACRVPYDGSVVSWPTDDAGLGVIFSSSTVSLHKIMTGTSVKIYPPWYVVSSALYNCH